MVDLEDTRERATSQLDDRDERTRKRRYVRPAVDIYATDTETVVLADMPGVHKVDLDVRVEGDDLVIEAPVAGRLEEESALPWGYHRRFRLRSAFDLDQIAAHYEEGVLRITLPKRAAGGARKVKVD